jgi:hypothetical protein
MTLPYKPVTRALGMRNVLGIGAPPDVECFDHQTPGAADL